ncbi:MAG TPA: hypothetical protein VD789_03700, partial [Thermomicrobiales bacterium]|nr:hypothetical protein [Thermomicrobiales bacterium]
VVIALGRCPDPALALQARAASAFDRNLLIDMPLLAADGATSLQGVFVAGEAAGRASLTEARDHGSVAGVAAARVATGGAQSSELRPVSSTATMRGWPIPADPGTVICREQCVTLGTVRAAMEAGAHDVNDLRRRTRAGMGRRGGGDVLPVLAALLMDADPSIPDERLTGRHRPPARPLPFSVVLNTAGDRHQ